MTRFLIVLLSFFAACSAQAADSAGPLDLWPHVRNVRGLGELRGVTADLGPDRVLRLQVDGSAQSRYAWATVPAPNGGWPLARRRTVEAAIANRSSRTVEVALWAVGSGGWDAVMEFSKLAPGQARTFACDLRSTFPDGTPKVDPSRISRIQVMLRAAAPGDVVEVRSLQAAGEAPSWVRPATRLDVPDMTLEAPAPGRRVRFILSGDSPSSAYSVLHLPRDWTPGRLYPVIAEYPGNVFYDPACYSTGRPERCVIGYGISRGSGAIWVSLPFVDARSASIVENGWGDADATADYAVRALDEICRRFGGDPSRLFLTGFSRGAIACGYIGLRNDRIARLWKAMHTCQHFDGDGWTGASMPGALERAKRFAGRPFFHTDNSAALLRNIMQDAGIPAVYADSGLGAHSSAMFLDDRPSTLQLRRWFQELAADPPAAFPGKRTVWQGYPRYDFELAGRPVTIVAPSAPAEGKPWLWRGEFFGAFPSVDLALLKLGWHVVYMSCPNTFGSPDTMKRWDRLYSELTRSHGFSKRPVLLGMSRGGLYVYRWAAKHPGKVGLIYGDAPVCDVKSWPGGKGKGKGSPRDWELFKQVFGLSEQQALKWKQNPIDLLKPIARARIPVIHVVGNAVDVVPVEENTAVLKQRFEALGGRMEIISKPGVGHHPHSLEDPAPIVNFILEHRLRK